MFRVMYGRSLMFSAGFTTRACTSAGYTLATSAQTRAKGDRDDRQQPALLAHVVEE